MKRKRRPKIGDVFEIPTPKGLAYVQYIYEDRFFGALLRVLPGLYTQRPSDFKELVKQKERFVMFFGYIKDLEEFLKAEFVAHEEVPEHAKKLPLFRSYEIVGIKDGKNIWAWGVVDITKGERKWRRARKKELATEEFWELPILVLEHDQVFLDRLMDLEWTWARERYLPGEKRGEGQEAGKEMEEEKVGEGGQPLPHVVHHFLYFPTKRQAEAAAKELQGKVYKVLVTKLEDRLYSVMTINWFMMDEEFWDKVYSLDDELEGLAERYGGKFDWHEIGLVPGRDPLYEDYEGEG